MIKQFSFLVFILLLTAYSPVQQTATELHKLSGPYLGQKPPGKIAELFAPGIVSTGNFEHSSPVFTPDLSEIYWSTIVLENGKPVLSPTYYMKLIDGIWSRRQISSFGDNFHYFENPFISPDGNKLYFHASKVFSTTEYDLYFVTRVGEAWSEPIKMDESINTPDQYEAQPTVSKNGTIYFIGFYEKSVAKCGLYFSKLVNGKYQKPVLMEEKFNSCQYDRTPYIAANESYFIFSSFRDGGFGSGDLYICFKEKDGSWGDVINMGDKINTDANERFPNVTPDGKYLFFNSTRKIQGADPNSPGNGGGDIYWIDTKIIEELKEKKNEK